MLKMVSMVMDSFRILNDLKRETQKQFSSNRRQQYIQNGLKCMLIVGLIHYMAWKVNIVRKRA